MRVRVFVYGDGMEQMYDTGGTVVERATCSACAVNGRLRRCEPFPHHIDHGVFTGWLVGITAHHDVVTDTTWISIRYRVRRGEGCWSTCEWPVCDDVRLPAVVRSRAAIEMSADVWDAVEGFRRKVNEHQALCWTVIDGPDQPALDPDRDSWWYVIGEPHAR